MYKLVLAVFMICLSCNSRDNYNDSRLIDFLSKELNYNAETRRELIVIILQNEECICTQENIELALDIIDSEIYSEFNKLLIVKSEDHKILLGLESNLKKVDVFINNSSLLEKYGLYFATDRIFLYYKNDFVTYDIHTETVDHVREKIF